MRFLKTRWYVAAWPEEVSETLLARTILNQPVVLFRKADGVAVALSDRCPHRFAPLSLGRLTGDIVECGYHGLQFDATGKCVLNPHGNRKIPSLARVATYPLIERHGLIWIWMGSAAEAETTPIPELSFMSGPSSGYQTVHNYIHAKFSSDILIDNLMDLSHAEFLHRGSFSAGYAPRSEMKIVEDGDTVSVDRTLFSVEMPPFMTSMYDANGQAVDHWYIYKWEPAGIIKYEFGVTAEGASREQGVLLYATHIATPESELTTHYFASISRGYDFHNAELDAFWRDIQYQPVATEDSPMLEAVQKRMGTAEFWDLKPLLFQIDAAPVKVRRVMERLVRQSR